MIKQEILEDWIKKLDNMIDKFENNAPKWISISEEIPEVGEVVIVSTGNEIFTDIYRGNMHDEWNKVDLWATSAIGAVEYWMRIPDIPNIPEDENNKKKRIKEDIKQWFKIESFRYWFENYCGKNETVEITYPEFLETVQEKIDEFKQSDNWRLRK